MTETLLIVALAWSGIQFGSLWIIQTSILPLLNSLSADRYIDTCRRIEMTLFHKIALTAGIGIMLVGAFLVTQLEGTGAKVAVGAAAAMMVAVGGISEGKNRPIWRMIEKWQPDTVPDNWEQLRRTWGLGHSLRTAAAFIAVVCFATAVLIQAA